MAQNFDFWTKQTPFSIFVDPAHCLGFVGDIHHRSNTEKIDDPDDPNGTMVQPYIDRLNSVCSFYTYMSDIGDVRNQNGTYFTGWTGFVESYARTPPEDRRNVMINVQEYWTLEALQSPNYYVTTIQNENSAGATFGYGQDTLRYDPANATGITFPAVPTAWKTDPQIVAEFARQASMGVPYLSGGITPSTPGITMGVFKNVAKRFWNDMAAYAKSRGSECVIHYTDFGASQLGAAYVPSIGLRSQPTTNGRSWWRRSFWYPSLYDSVNVSKEKGVLTDLADASLSADMYGGSVYNWCANIGDSFAVGAWHTPVNRLVDAGGGLSSVASDGFALGDLNYWAAKGAGALMHEYYEHVDGLATTRSNPRYRKGCAMVVQLDAPIISRPNEGGGGVFAAQKWGYMKDPTNAALIDIFGAFGSTDGNVPDLRKPDQVWVWSSAWYNNKLLFECGTGNAGDATPLFGNDEQTARFGILTARSQAEKRIFNRPMMQTSDPFGPSEASILDTYGIDDVSAPAQAARLSWLERNTLPNVYWDARVGGQYTEGASNNVRFWSAATGNCLPSPCVFDRNSPIAPYLNFNNDLYKNDVRVAFKKWVSEQNVTAIEEAHRVLSDILFTPTIQGKKPTLYADPDTLIGWYPYEEGYTGTTANAYKDRVLKAAAPYTLISSGSGVFHDSTTGQNYFDSQKRYFDAGYGVTAHYEVQQVYQGSSLYWLWTDGIRGGKSLPPYSSRAVMFNVEYPWLNVFATRISDSVSYTNDVNTKDVIAEFARQASLGPVESPHLFPPGHPEGGLTPGSTLSNYGIYRKVGAKLWNDLSEYSKSNSTPLNTAKRVIHYAGTPYTSDHGVPRSGIRSAANTVPPFRSYWLTNEGDCGGSPCLGSYDTLYEGVWSFTGDIAALYASQVSADALAISWYNPYPSAIDWAEGATFWFGDFQIPQRKSADGSSLSQTYSFGDLEYWQTKEQATQNGRYRKALIDSGIMSADADSQKKSAAIITPLLSYEGGELLAPHFNHWSGSRLDPTLAGTIDAISALATPDVYNKYAKPVDEIWVWDQAEYYWWDIPTKSTYKSNNTALTQWPFDADPWNGRQTIWARNMLEKVLFGRPKYPTALKELIEESGLSMAQNANNNRGKVQTDCANWLFDNSLTDGWWARSGPGAENRKWYENGVSLLPSPCVLSPSSPLAPWLNFNSTIRTEHIHTALKIYVSDYACRYVEAVRRTIDRLYP